MQLVVAGSEVDNAYVSLRRLLRSRPDLVERSFELKRACEWGKGDEYAAAEKRFIEDLSQEID